MKARTVAFLLLCLAIGSQLIAQEQVGNSQGLMEADSQNWSRNWADGWRKRLEKRASNFQKLTRWQVSDHTLISLYGQINAGHLQYDDGFETINTLRDNPNSPTRLGVRVDTEQKSGRTFLINFEAAAPKSNYNSFFVGGVGSGGGSDWNKKLIRKAEARWFVPNLGFFSVGQGSMAADGITGFDFSGTNIVASNSVADSVSGIPATLSDGTESALNLTSFFPTYDASRRLRLRFDSAHRNNMSFAFSVGREVLRDNNDNTYADIAWRYESSWRGFGIKGGLGYSYNGNDPGYLSGSIAGLNETNGLNFAVALGTNTEGGQYSYVKLGWKNQFIPQGVTSFSVDYYQSNDPQPAAFGSNSWGITAVQRINVRDWDIYATYREYAVDGSVANYTKSQAIMFGVRLFW